MPNARLKVSQMMTIGAKRLPIFEVPKGWIRKSRIRIAHEVPTIVDLLMSGLTTVRLHWCLVEAVRMHIKHLQSLPLYGAEDGLSRGEDSICEIFSEGSPSISIELYLT